MKVMMLVNTNFQGFKAKGKTYEGIPRDIALRWEHRGICSIFDAEDIVKANPDEALNFEEMPPKALFEYCKTKGFEYNKEALKGKSPEERKEYLISLILEQRG